MDIDDSLVGAREGVKGLASLKYQMPQDDLVVVKVIGINAEKIGLTSR